MPKGIYIRTEKIRKALSDARKRDGIRPPSQLGKRGSLHWNWQGGKVSENNRFRQTAEYKQWRKSVFERDDYTCVICKKRGVKLNADHIKPFCLFPELRLDINNGRTLCVECHQQHGEAWGAKTPKHIRVEGGRKGGNKLKEKMGIEYYSLISRGLWDKKRGPTVHIPILFT